MSFDANLPLVAIVGRPNVGKSTFFNRLIGRRKSLVKNMAGVTRDRIYDEADYLNRRFILVDTGGFEPDVPEGHIYRHVRDQAILAIEEADIILFFVDGREGLNPSDGEVAQLLRAGTKKPVFLVVNKIDTPALEVQSYEFYALGFEELFPISSETGLGGDALLDALLKYLPEPPPPQEKGGFEPFEEVSKEEAFDEPEADDALWEEGLREYREDLDEDHGDDDFDVDEESGELGEAASTPEAPDTSGSRARHFNTPRLALIGRPNVGKSSLGNRLLGEERLVVHDLAGTTRDPVDLTFEWEGESFELMDTAGIRRQARISDKLEKYTVIKAFKAIARADICLLLLDPAELVTGQEQRLAGMVEEKGKALMIIVNKWDLYKGQTGISRKEVEEIIREKMPYAAYAPVVFLSAKTGLAVHRLLPRVKDVLAQHRRRLKTSELNAWLKHTTERVVAPMYRGNPVTFLYITQVRDSPPTFLVFVNNPEGVKQDYRRYLKNQLRETFGFEGTPARILLRRRKNRR